MFLQTLRSPATLFALAMAAALLIAAGVMEADALGGGVTLGAGR